MKRHLRNALLAGLFFIPTLFGRAQKLSTRPSLHDSLRQMLTHIEAKTKNDILQNVVREAKTLYTGNVINDSLAKKLLIADSLLVNALPVDQPVAYSYANVLVQLFKDLPPKQEHHDYASSLSHLANFFLNIFQYKKALPLCEQALAIRKK